MKKLTIIVLLLFLSGCSLFESSKKIYSFDELVEVDDLTVEVFTASGDDPLRRVKQDEFLDLLQKCEFVSSDDVTYDKGIKLSSKSFEYLVYFTGSLSDEVKVVITSDSEMYEAVAFDNELVMMYLEELSYRGVWSEEYEEVMTVDGYTLYSMTSDIYTDYLLSDFNPELYLAVKDYPQKYEEIDLGNGEFVYELVSRSYTEYLITNLKYFRLSHYVVYGDEVYSIHEFDDIPYSVLNEFVKNVGESVLSYYSIQLE